MMRTSRALRARKEVSEKRSSWKQFGKRRRPAHAHFSSLYSGGIALRPALKARRASTREEAWLGAWAPDGEATVIGRLTGKAAMRCRSRVSWGLLVNAWISAVGQRGLMF